MACIALGAVGLAVSLFGSSKKNKAAKAAADAQRKAAELQTLVARELHAHWQQFYSACDIATIQEVCAVPPYTPNYAGIDSRVRLAALRDFGIAALRARLCQEHFCVPNVDCNFLVGVEAQATVDTMNFGFRREEGLKIQLDQIRLENKRSFLALGRGLLKTSSDAAQLAAKIGAALKGWLGSPSQGWLEFAGFLGSPEGKRFADDVTGGMRRILGTNAESPSRGVATSYGTNIDYTPTVLDLPPAAGSGTQQPTPLALPAPVVQGEMSDGSSGGNLGNSIGLPIGAMNYAGGGG